MMAATAIALGGRGFLTDANDDHIGKSHSERSRENAIMHKSRVKDINRILSERFSELHESTYAQYPMHFDKWYDPTADNGPDGKPCFILSTFKAGTPRNEHNSPLSEVPIKRNYTHCYSGPLGEGYYSLNFVRAIEVQDTTGWIQLLFLALLCEFAVPYGEKRAGYMFSSYKEPA